MPGPGLRRPDRAFYEDFPYAWWDDFRALEDLPAGALAGLPEGVSLTPSTPTSATSSSARSAGIAIYESQIERLFDGPEGDGQGGPRPRDPHCASSAGSPAALAERYWATTPA